MKQWLRIRWHKAWNQSGSKAIGHDLKLFFIQATALSSCEFVANGFLKNSLPRSWSPLFHAYFHLFQFHFTLVINSTYSKKWCIVSHSQVEPGYWFFHSCVPYQSYDLEKDVIYRSEKRKRQSIPQNTRKLTNLSDFSSWRKSKTTSCFPEWICDKIKDIFSITFHLFYIGLRILVYIYDKKSKDLLG